MKTTSKTNWEQVDALTDEQIDLSEIPALGDDFFDRATLRKPTRASVTVEVDAETLSWYEAQGERGQERMTIALRLYAHAHRA